MENIKLNTLDILYGDKKIEEFEYSLETKLKDLKNFLSNKYNLNTNYMRLIYDKYEIEDENIVLTKILLTNLVKISGEKLNVRVIPQIYLKKIKTKFVFIPINYKLNQDDQNSYVFYFDLITIKSDYFKKEIYDFFTKKLEEMNYKINHINSEFYNSAQNQELIFDNENNSLSNYFGNKHELIELFFIIKNSSIHFYRHTAEEEHLLNSNEYSTIELRKPISDGRRFKIILQTYNSTVQEMEVTAEMTVSELKDLIEHIIGIRKSYQELLYLVYKLNDDKKKLKDYYVRPQGIVFLRGFYFPLIFTDFYQKSVSNIIRINIAEQVSRLKEELIKKLNLNYSEFTLVTNGKEMEENRYLIDYNIQKMQTIYIK